MMPDPEWRDETRELATRWNAEIDEYLTRDVDADPGDDGLNLHDDEGTDA